MTTAPGLIHARWTETILDDCFSTIVAARPDLHATVLKRTRNLMIAGVADCMIEGHEPLIDGLDLPDPDDRHVLAAAIPGFRRGDRHDEPARLPSRAPGAASGQSAAS